MEDVELLLSDEFASFTATITKIHEDKKIEQEKFKELYEQYKARIETFGKRAHTAQEVWEAWKASQGAKAQPQAEKPKTQSAEKPKTQSAEKPKTQPAEKPKTQKK